MELIIDPEFKNLIPPMKPEEFQGLIESIAKYGYDDLYPIVIWNDIIIDGHNRYLICKELNIDFSVSEKDFDNRVEVINWIINNQLNRRSMTNEQRNYLIGKRYQEEKKEECKQKIKEDVVSLITMRPLDGIVEQKIAKKYQVSPNAVRKAEKFANAIDEVANNANINPYKILGREIKGTRKDIVELSQKPAELQKEIIEKVEKKEIPNIKTALKEIEDEVIFDEIEECPEINLKENEDSSPYDLAEKIFGLINNYKKEYDDIDLDFIKNTLEIVNENLNERVKI
jgi:ParB-like chromosome segregation protein Spo0J